MNAALRCIVIILGAMLIAGAAPSSQPTERVRNWYRQLADTDAAIRDKAIESLMGLKSDELPQLRKLVEESVLPSQKAVLREIVTHVFTADLPYEPNPIGNPLMGLSWAQPQFELLGLDFINVPDDEKDKPKPPEGIPIGKRVIGFPAYRALREGDVIKAVETSNDAVVPITEVATFIRVVGGFRPGDTVMLRIIRDGREMRVGVQVQPRPAIAESGEKLEAWMAERVHEADIYWDQTFAPLLNETDVVVGPSAAAGR